MTIQDAIKSGEPFYRPTVGITFSVSKEGEILDDCDYNRVSLLRDEILAEDWEIKKDDPKEEKEAS